MKSSKTTNYSKTIYFEYEDSLENGGVAGDDERAYEVVSDEGSEKPVDLQREMQMRLAEDLDLLESDLELSDDDRYSVNLEAYPAVVAMLADGRARFGYEFQALVEYGLQTFDVGAAFSRDEVPPVDGFR